MEAFLGSLQGIDFLLTHLLVGGLIFQTLILPRESRPPIQLRRLAGLTLAGTLAYTIFSAVSMSDSLALPDLWTVLSKTTFGHLACLKILALAVWVSGFSAREFLALLALGLPFASVLSGHAAAQGNALQIAVTWAHSLSVAIWTGGLWNLFFWLKTPIAPEVIVGRFSRYAMASTACILASGILMANWAGVSLAHPAQTPYGELVLAKLIVFSGALAAASVNQFVHLRKRSFQRLRREVGIELVLVFSAFGLAGFLTRAMPPH